jgi:hypothetical protein
MDILFICGCIEPGKDGVGDYTRRLACELIRQGHNTSIISLFDNIADPHRVEVQRSDDVDISVLRISNLTSTKTGRLVAEKWIVDFNPSIISLQFVVFSFHEKGLPLFLVKFLITVGKGRRWHLMLHELWVGMPEGASKKHVLWGWLQRQIVFLIIRKLNPVMIHTQSMLYQAQLQRHHLVASFLPLFSNIPIAAYRSLTQESRLDESIMLVIFGTIHPHSQIDALINEARHFCQHEKKEVSLVFLGRCGIEQNVFTYKWKSAGLRAIHVGDQPPEIISEILKNSNIGINTGAIQMIDKSGTAAAMLDHGLPIICISRPWRARGIQEFNAPKGIFECKPGCITSCLAFKPMDRSLFSVKAVAEDLVKSLA